MNTLNYMDAGLKKAGDGLDSLSGSKLKNVYVVATGADREEALRLNEQVQARLDRLILDKTVTTVSGEGFPQSRIYSGCFRRIF